MNTTRRTTELGLVVLGALVTAGLYTLASLGTTASIPADVGPFLAMIFGLFGIAHVVTRRLAPTADGTLLPIAGLLNGLGYVFIARIDEQLAGLQATWTAVGIGAYIGTLVVVRRTRDLEGYRYTFMLIGIGLLLLPLVPGVGRTINGARIWVSIGPVNFQPGEFAKIVLAIFFASYLVEKREVLGIAARRIGPLVLPELRHFGPVLLAWGTSLVVMISEKDLGSSLLFFALFIAMLWMATERFSYLAIGGGLFAAGAIGAFLTFSHVERRVDVWLNPWADPSGAGFQVVQSTFALAWGGVFGTGPGLGNPDVIPAAESDFIFAAIGEEMGLLGTTAVLVAFLLMIGAGLRIAIRADAPFDKLLAAGLTTILGVQSFIIIGGVIRLVPLTGITLPFVSYGGSSLIANYVLLGLLMRVSASENERAAVAADPTTVVA
ncbi:MAG TPA: FtsW/RodA/SpoVE family cell cycle protein [Acidimicrobiales bacterium]|nr:FtsW/RodA/SpoVE family cell cycle protein [Acidimicrobiales bacterium]